MSVYINPFTDTGFKILFGQETSKPLLIDFLNNLLADEETIVDATFMDKERPRIFKGDRGLIYDIYCATSDGRKIIVEMQNKSQEFFIERSIYYVSQAVSRQGKKGEWDYNFEAVYFVAFMNFKLDALKEFRTDVQLMNTKTKEVVSHKVKFIYLQLPYFKKEQEDCKTNFDRWIYIFKNMETLKTIPWPKNSIFAQLGEVTRIANLSERQRRRYDADLKILRDNANIFKFAQKQAREEGVATGIATGIAKGIAKGRSEVAVNMLKKGMPVELVAEIAMLPITEVEKLQAELSVPA